MLTAFGTLFLISELIVACCWRGSAVKQTAKAGVLYFMLVFSAGFVLGTIRTPHVVFKAQSVCLDTPSSSATSSTARPRLDLLQPTDHLRFGVPSLRHTFLPSLSQES